MRTKIESREENCDDKTTDSLHRRPACARPPPPRLSLIQTRLPVTNTESKAKLLPSGTGSANSRQVLGIFGS